MYMVLQLLEVKFMEFYYVAMKTRSHAFYLEEQMRIQNIQCELTYLPAEITGDMCAMGVRFPGDELEKAAYVLNLCGLPGCRVYKLINSAGGYAFSQVML